MTTRRDEWIGMLLVALQFGLIALLVALAWHGITLDRHHRPASLFAWIAAACGLGRFAWAVWANRPGNFNIRPAPRAGARLVTQGPYRLIRHPMYTAVFACAIAAALLSDSLAAWLACAALVGVLGTRAAIE